jgi:hypothetical protein
VFVCCTAVVLVESKSMSVCTGSMLGWVSLESMSLYVNAGLAAL